MLHLKKYWHIALILLLSSLLLVAKLLKKKVSKKPNNNTKQQGKEVLERLGNVDPLDYDDYMKHALDLTHHLGTSYSWYDPRRWTENDKDVYDILKPLSKSQLKVVAEIYRTYTDGRDLYRDLSSMLDKKYYVQLTNL